MSDGAVSNVANDEREKHDGAGEPIDVVVVASAEAPPSPPPDGGYGWVCVLACFCVNAFTWGVVAVGLHSHLLLSYHQGNPISVTLTRISLTDQLPYQSYGVYLSYYLSHALYPTATSTSYAFIGGLNFSIAMLLAPLITIFARHYNTRATMILGSLLLTSGFISASFATKIWHLYLSQGVLVGAGVGFVSIPCIAILPQWFDKRRSLAGGISSAGSGIGGLIFSFATQAMIENISLAWSLRITGIVVGIMNLIAALTIRNRNKAIKPPQRGFDMKLLRRYDVLLLLAWAFISMLGYITLLYSLSDFARSIGLDANQAGAITAFLNLGTAVGRPMIGVVSDRYGRMETAGLITFFCGVICFAIWLPAKSYGVTIFFAIVVGAILGVFWMVSIIYSQPIAVKHSLTPSTDHRSHRCRSGRTG